MADRSLDNEKKQVNDEKKTLNEVVNNLDIVKSLRRQFPEKLGTFDFLSSVISVLERQGFRGKNAFTGTTMLTEEEIDFIKSDDGLDLITNQISDDVSKTQNGIVLVGGVVDDRASFEQQEANDISVEEAGAYFVEAKRAQERIETGVAVGFYSSFEEAIKEINKIDEEQSKRVELALSGGTKIDWGLVEETRRRRERDLSGPKTEGTITSSTSEQTKEKTAPQTKHRPLSKKQISTVFSNVEPMNPTIIKKKIEAAAKYDFMSAEDKIEAYRAQFGVENMSFEEIKMVMSAYQMRGKDASVYAELAKANNLYEASQMPVGYGDYYRFALETDFCSQLDRIRERIDSTGEKKIDIEELEMLMHALTYTADSNKGILSSAQSLLMALDIPIEGDSYRDLMNVLLEQFKGVIPNNGKYNMDPNRRNELFRTLAEQGRNKVESSFIISVNERLASLKYERLADESIKSDGLDYLDSKVEKMYVAILAQMPDKELRTLEDRDKMALYLSVKRDILYEEFLKDPDALSVDDKIKAYALVRQKDFDQNGQVIAPNGKDNLLRLEFSRLLIESLAKDFNIDIGSGLDGYRQGLTIITNRLRESKEFADSKAPLTALQRKLSAEEVEKFNGLQNIEEKITQTRETIKKENESFLSKAKIKNEVPELFKESTSATDYLVIIDRAMKDISKETRIQSLEYYKKLTKGEKADIKGNGVDYEGISNYQKYLNMRNIAIIVNKKDDKVSSKELLKLVEYMRSSLTDTEEQHQLRELVAAKISKINPNLIRVTQARHYSIDLKGYITLGKEVFGDDKIKFGRDIKSAFEQITIEDLDRELAKEQKELSQREKNRKAKHQYKESHSVTTEIYGEFKAVCLENRAADDAILLASIRKKEAGIQLSEEEEKTFSRCLKNYLMDRRLTPDEMKAAYDASSRHGDASEIAKYIAEHEKEVIGVTNMNLRYSNLSSIERAQINLRDMDYLKRQQQAHLKATRNMALKVLEDPNVRKFSIKRSTEKTILEMVAYCLKSEDEKDKEVLERMKPHLEKISKRLVTKDEDGKLQIDEQFLMDLYSKRASRTIKSPIDIAHLGIIESNANFEQRTVNEVATRTMTIELEAKINAIINSNKSEEEKREALRNLGKNIRGGDPRSKVNAMFVYGKIERSISLSEKRNQEMLTLTTEADKAYEGTTMIPKKHHLRNVDSKRVETILQDEKIMSDLADVEKTLIGRYIDNSIDAEKVEDSLAAAKKFTDFSTLGEDVAKQIFMFQQATDLGPEATVRYLRENPEYDSFLDEGTMNIMISLKRAKALVKLEEGLQQESPKVDNDAINLIMHCISFSSNNKNIMDLTLQYAEKLLSPEQIEECLPVIDGEKRLNDIKLLELLEAKMNADPSISDVEKLKFSGRSYKDRDYTTDRIISSEILREARTFITERGVNEEELPMLRISTAIEKYDPNSEEKETEDSTNELTESPEESKETGDEVKQEEPAEEVAKGDAEETGDEEKSTSQEESKISDKHLEGMFNSSSVVFIGQDSIVPAQAIETEENRRLSDELIGSIPTEDLKVQDRQTALDDKADDAKEDKTTTEPPQATTEGPKKKSSNNSRPKEDDREMG